MGKPAWLRRTATFMGWTRHSIYLMATYLLVMAVVTWFWWPLAREAFVSVDTWGDDRRWHFDWLLLGNFLAMFLLIMAKANLRRDAKIALAGLIGGLAIETWGTQTNLWSYYTSERPPLWIIPAWPISSLAIDRLGGFLDWMEATINRTSTNPRERWVRVAYWVIFMGFYALMIWFVSPSLNKSLTWAALLICGCVIWKPSNQRWMIFTFLAGTGLGYFLERWGTTRECWTYYTHQTPPPFAVLAHGMACVCFWRARELVERAVKLFRKST